MSDNSTSLLGTLIFGGFIAGKIIGVLASWSWWWLFMPIVPLIGETLIRYGVK